MNILSSLKKGLAGLSVIAMAFTIVPFAAVSAVTFTDSMEIPSWATEAIDELNAMGVISGNADGSFAPARQLNRAEVAKIIVLASGVDYDTYGGPHFPDVMEDAWYYDAIETMYSYGWVNGYPDGMFRPGNGINRAEIAKMVVNALELDMDTSGAPHFDDVRSSDWFFDYVETAYNYDLMRGYADGTFGPTKAVTRAETAKIVYDGLLVTTMPSGPAEGTLEVSLSRETPRGTNVPYNATSVPYTTVEFTASDDSDVEVSSVTLTRLGLGDNDDFNSVWMEIDGFKVGNDKSINNDDVVELRFNPPVVVPAGQTLMADIVASAKFSDAPVDHNIGHNNRLALVSASDVASTAMNVVGDFPIEGEEMQVADYQVSMIDFSNLGSDTTINVGDNYIEIGKFRMLNESTSNKDIELRAITFKNDGTAELENVLENAALYVSGEQVSAESIIDGDYVTFRLDNGVTGGYILEDGDSRIFSMRADIVSAEKDDTMEFKVDNYEDIVAIEIGTSFGVKTVSDSGNASGAGAGSVTCTNADAEDNCARLAVYTIDSGDINVSRDPSSLGNQQYAPGSNDVVAMTARVIVDQPLLADGITLTATYGNTATATLLDTTTEVNAAFSNFRLFLNDSLVDSDNATTEGSIPGVAAEDTSGRNVQLVYDTTFEIGGASILKLVMNVQDGANTGDWIKFNLLATDFSSPEYISTGDQIETTQMLGSSAASRVEVSQSTLTVTKTDGFSGETIVAGLDDVTMMEFVLDNNDSGDVNITSISIDGDGVDASATEENFTAAIFVDGTQQGSSKNLDSAGLATFNDLSVVIPSAGQKEFAVVLNTLEASADGSAVTVTSGATAVAQVGTITFGGAESTGGDDVLTTTITDAGGTSTFTTTVAAGTAATDAGTVVSVVTNVDSTATYTAVEAAGVVTITSGTVSIPFTAATVLTTGTADEVTIGALVTTIDDVAAVTATSNTADYATITIGGTVDATDQFSATIAGTTYTTSGAGATPTLKAVELAALIDAVTGYTAPVPTTGAITVTGTAAFTFTVNEIGALLDASTIVGVSGEDDTLTLNVTAVDADNVENGQTVATTTLPLPGTAFELVQSGTLTVQAVSSVSSDILIAGTDDVEVLKIQLSADDDAVQIKDLYFDNNAGAYTDFGPRADFKLYNEAGQLIQTKQMATGDLLHFELANQSRINVPKDDSTYVYVKVDVRDINDVAMSGKQLNLTLDVSHATLGVEALTAATGTDITTPSTWGTAVGENFVAYRSKITLDRVTPSNTTLVAGVRQELYRFMVTSDSAGSTKLNRVSLKATNSAGAIANLTVEDAADTAKVYVPQVGEDTTQTLALTEAITATGVQAITSAGTDVKVVLVPFGDLLIASGESKTFVVYGDVATAGANTAVSMTMIEDTAIHASAPGLSSAVSATSYIIWADESSNAADDFNNGYLLKPDKNATTISVQ